MEKEKINKEIISIAAKLVSIREKRGFTKYMIAKQSGMNPQTVHNVEAGENVSLATLIEYLNELDMCVSFTDNLTNEVVNEMGRVSLLNIDKILFQVGDLLHGIGGHLENKFDSDKKLSRNFEIVSLISKLMFKYGNHYNDKFIMENFLKSFPEEIQLKNFLDRYNEGDIPHHVFIELCDRLLFNSDINHCIQSAMQLNSHSK